MRAVGVPRTGGRAGPCSRTASGVGNVWAVGSRVFDGYQLLQGPTPLVLHWDGSTWTEVYCPLAPLPPVGSPGYQLHGVASAAERVLVVGSYPGVGGGSWGDAFSVAGS